MKINLNLNRKKVFYSIISLVVLIGLVFLLNISVPISRENIREIVSSFGFFGPFILIIFYALSVVLSPIAGSPFILTGLTLYGFIPAFICVYLGNIIGATINFGIAKLAGRPLIRKLVGTKEMDEVDKYANIVGVKTLIIFRIIGGAGFDFISYAAGLTPMNFSVYFTITAVFSIPSLLALVYMFDRALNLHRIFIIPLILCILIFTIVIPYYVYRRQKILKKEINNNEN